MPAEPQASPNLKESPPCRLRAASLDASLGLKALATLTWLATLWTVAAAGRLEPEDERSQRAAPASSPAEHPAPALTRG